jgi:UDP-glucose:(heptosyl)LPS alpha-1,3-glucosyltransferase
VEALLKVAFIRQKYDPFGDAERYTQRVLTHMAERGAQIHLLARDWKHEPPVGLTFHTIRCPKSPSWFRQRCFVTRVQRHLSQADYDLIQSGERIPGCHVYRAGEGVHARWLEIRRQMGGRRERISVILNPYNLLVCQLERRLYEDPRLMAVIVNSEMVRHEIRAHFKIDDRKIHTIYNGVDLIRYNVGLRDTLGKAFRRSRRVDDRQVVVLFVGSGYERQGLATLIHAVAATQHPICLWVVGKGKVTRYQHLAQQLSVADRVTFFGARDDVDRFYAAADIFALPSCYDPFPSAALEAMAVGLPIIVSVNCGAAEIIGNGREGFVLDSVDETGQLARYIDLACDPEKRAQMSARARSRAEDFSLETSLAAYESLYRRVLAERRRIFDRYKG